MDAEADLFAWRPILLFVLLVVLAFGWFRWRESSAPQAPQEKPVIEKQPEVFTSRTFDRTLPPADLPPLAEGEAAECDSTFMSKASVAGRSEQSDDTHAVVTFTHVQITLQLKITIWVPSDSSQHVIEHEEGHRQISEFYYKNADQLAERIASKYLGKAVSIAGPDLKGEFDKLLQRAGTEITDEYRRELNVQSKQLRYDAITDHSRNDVDARDAVAQALKDVEAGSTSGVVSTDGVSLFVT
jgi:hypothetical protein